MVRKDRLKKAFFLPWALLFRPDGEELDGNFPSTKLVVYLIGGTLLQVMLRYMIPIKYFLSHQQGSHYS